MPIFEIKFRRIEEGTFRVGVPDESVAKRILDVELACGTAPLTKAENTFVQITQIDDGGESHD